MREQRKREREERGGDSASISIPSNFIYLSISAIARAISKHNEDMIRIK